MQTKQQNRLDTLRGNCLMYVHGHSAGGTNPSLAEAMCPGLPIVALDIIYNRETADSRVLYFKTKRASSKLSHLKT